MINFNERSADLFCVVILIKEKAPKHMVNLREDGRGEEGFGDEGPRSLVNFFRKFPVPDMINDRHQ